MHTTKFVFIEKYKHFSVGKKSTYLESFDCAHLTFVSSYILDEYGLTNLFACKIAFNILCQYFFF